MKMTREERYKKLFEILDPLSKNCSDLTDDQLYSLWVKVSKISGWAGIIGVTKLLPEDTLLRLEVLDDETIGIIKKEEEYYFSKIVPDVRKKLNEFKKEVRETDPEFVKERRSEYLKNEIRKLEKEIETIFEVFKKNGFSFMGDVILDVNNLFPKRRKLKKLLFEYRNLEFKDKVSSTISEEDIEMAASADCSQFVDVKRRVGGKSWSLCPYHEDSHPSLCCYEGEKGFYCFSCNKGGNAIHLVRQIHNLGFKEAIRFINNN